jgi:hypothetical protein
MKNCILYTISVLLLLLLVWQCGPAIDKQLDFQEKVYARDRAALP